MRTVIKWKILIKRRKKINKINKILMILITNWKVIMIVLVRVVFFIQNNLMPVKVKWLIKKINPNNRNKINRIKVNFNKIKFIKKILIMKQKETWLILNIQFPLKNIVLIKKIFLISTIYSLIPIEVKK